jgi:uncharacterized protein YoxC
MDSTLAIAAMSTPSLVLRYAAAFFFVVVAIALAYALVKAAKALERVDKVLADVDEQGIPLMKKAGSTLDGVNANLGNVDEITKDVAGITDKLDNMATAVEGAVTAPARKAAAFSAGVQSAVSSFMHRDKSGEGSTAPQSGSADGSSPADSPWTAAGSNVAGDTFEPAQPVTDASTAAESPAQASGQSGEGAPADVTDAGAATPASEGSPWDSPAS